MKNIYSLETFLLCCLVVLIESCSKETSNNLSSVISSVQIDDTSSGSTRGLVAWYTFENGSTKDMSGNDNDVIFNNATATVDRNGVANGAYLFNGIDNYMRVANSATLRIKRDLTLYAIV